MTTRGSIQWWPNLVPKEWRVCLFRACWDHGTPGDGKGYSRKVSVSLCLRPYEMWVGLRLVATNLDWDRFALINIVPMVQVRIHSKWAYGGSFVSRI